MTPGRRRYDSPLRAAQAGDTRAAILAAATELFQERGWNGAGMRDVADVAHVSIETVYSRFGSKAELLKQALDVAVVGDTAPVPLADRGDFQRLAQGTVDERAETAVQLVIAIHLRTARLNRVLEQAANGDPQLTEILANTRVSQRESVRQGAAAVARRDVSDQQVDTLFGILSPEVFLLLTDTCGWDVSTYQTQMVRLIRTVLEL